MKKHNWLKVMFITLFIVVIATWGLSVTRVVDGEFVTSDSTKIGLFNIASYLMVALQYFANISIYILAVGGFYGVLYKIPQYRVLLEKVVNGFKNFEWLFMIIVGILFAVLSSMAGFSLPLLMLFPFVISVILLMGYDKLTAALLTIGSTIAGVIGTMFSTRDAYGITTVLGVNSNENIGWKVLLLVIALAIVLVNTILYARKHKNNEEIEEEYLVPKKIKTENKRVFPLIIVFDIIIVLLVLAFISWDVFGVDFFQNVTTAFVKPSGNVFTKGLFTSLNTIFGVSESLTFGNWSLLEAAVVLLLGSGLLAVMYRKSVNSYITDFTNGAKRAILPAFLVILAYTIFICFTNSPFLLTILRPILDVTKEASVPIMVIVVLAFSILTVEPYYGITAAGSYVLAVTSESNLLMVSLAWQSIYGAAMLVVPTSIILFATLSYLGVTYGKWLKTVWKIFLELVLIFVLLLFVVNMLNKKSNTLSCTADVSGQIMTIDAEYNDSNTKAESVTMEMALELPEDATEADVDNTKQILEASCAEKTYEKCEVTVRDNKLVVTMKGTPEDIGFGTGTMEEARLEAEQAGYVCK